MYVLVDYENVRQQLHSLSTKAIVERVVERICETLDEHPERMDIRLYGGWYEGESLSEQAQDLVGQLSDASSFPFSFRPINRKNRSFVRVQAEPAYSILGDSSFHLYNTVRPVKLRHMINVRSPQSPKLGERKCQVEMCPLRGLRRLIRDGRCANNGCTLTAEDLFPGRRQQKLVDTMLATDLLSAVEISDEPVVIVTSDDDLVPPIRHAVLSGASIYQIQVLNPSEKPWEYIPNSYPNYSSIVL